jgi:tetratricopeptide (TPR) repeat protein
MTPALRDLQNQILQHFDANDYERLEESCEIYLCLDPDNVQILRILGALLLNTKRPEEAEKHIRHRLSLQPNDPVAHRDLGQALYAQKKLDEAKGHYETAYRIDETVPGVFHGLGLIFKEKEQDQDALTAFDRELIRHPTDSAATLALAEILASKDRAFLASLLLKHVSEIDPRLAGPRKRRGEILQAAGFLDDAMEAYRSALTLQPSLAADLRKANVVADLNPELHRDETLYAFYDLGVSPLTFNIFHFLVLAEIQRKRLKLGRFHVVFVPGAQDSFGHLMENDSYLGQSGQDWRLQNLLFPATRLFPSCVGATICGSREEACNLQKSVVNFSFPERYRVDIAFTALLATRQYTMLQVVRVFQEFGATAFIRATDQASTYVRNWIAARSRGRQAVSLTLRQQDYHPGRNSNLEAWARFGHWLQDQGFMPIIVRDSETLYLPTPDALTGLPEMPEAAINVDIRAALNEVNYASLQTGSGTNALLYHSDRTRYAILRIIVDEHHASSREHFELSNGLKAGEQLPWSHPWQRFEYIEDSFDNLKASFERLVLAIEAHAERRSGAENTKAN